MAAGRFDLSSPSFRRYDPTDFATEPITGLTYSESGFPDVVTTYEVGDTFFFMFRVFGVEQAGDPIGPLSFAATNPSAVTGATMTSAWQLFPPWPGPEPRPGWYPTDEGGWFEVQPDAIPLGDTIPYQLTDEWYLGVTGVVSAAGSQTITALIEWDEAAFSDSISATYNATEGGAPSVTVSNGRFVADDNETIVTTVKPGERWRFRVDVDVHQGVYVSMRTLAETLATTLGDPDTVLIRPTGEGEWFDVTEDTSWAFTNLPSGMGDEEELEFDVEDPDGRTGMMIISGIAGNVGTSTVTLTHEWTGTRVT